VTRIAVSGIHLNIEQHGTGPAVLLLHGFTGSATIWSPFFETWPGFSLMAVDLLGHGDSDAPTDPARYRMTSCVTDLVALLDELQIKRTAMLGYSMGGRIALHLALHAPERVSALVVESASPGIEDTAKRAARTRSDAMLAEFIEREGTTAFVDRWQALPLFATQQHLPLAVREQVRQQRLHNSPLGLANSLRGVGAGMQEWLLPKLATLSMPTLLLTGALDTVYCELATRMTAALPCARMTVVPNAGHTVHLEQPEHFAKAVGAFLHAHPQLPNDQIYATQYAKEDIP
jgi:2-succinyl-6-hydroxy-2,4-cyclohexadiene-1-carboxylate synthase